MALILLAFLILPFIVSVVLGLYSWSKPSPVRVRVDDRINPNRLW
jgi:hypothetical protein